MIIALVGTPSAGKRSVLEYLVTRHDFQELYIHDGLDRLSIDPEVADPKTVFSTPDAMLDHVTRNWRSSYVTTALRTWDDVQPFLKRPFFLLVGIDGPMRTRFEREKRRGHSLTLEAFVDAHDELLYSTLSSSGTPLGPPSDLARVMSSAHIKINNRFPTLDELHLHLDQLNLLDEERLRPGWDLYFMTLATLAAHRSNCMKRRVGAVLVRSKRILSTGYNGTPRGTRNCNQGGCPRCNGPAKGGESLSNCLCLHAEENALLEAGRDRIGDDAVIYCNTCPCLLCSVKIVQCGVREVVYNQSYSMDTESAKVLEDGGVILRQLHMPIS